MFLFLVVLFDYAKGKTRLYQTPIVEILLDSGTFIVLLDIIH